MIVDETQALDSKSMRLGGTRGEFSEMKTISWRRPCRRRRLLAMMNCGRAGGAGAN